MSVTAIAAPAAPQPPERTEGAALNGILSITVDGEPLELPVLKNGRSRLWQRVVGAQMSAFPLPDALDATSAIDLAGNIATLGTESMLTVVAAYDTLLGCPPTCDRRTTPPGPEHEHPGPLGGREGIEERMSVTELHAAVKAMGRAEFPLLGDVRSVVEAFGPQIRAYVPLVMAQLGAALQRVSSTSGSSPTGDSTPTASESDSPPSSS